MIELDKKENAPSQQDVDSYVHSLYAYADNLISEGCYSCNYDKIRSDLSYFKIDESSITSIIDDIRGYFKEAKNRAATKELAYGAFWMALGFFLTHITDGNYIFYGAGVYGLYKLYIAFSIYNDN